MNERLQKDMDRIVNKMKKPRLDNSESEVKDKKDKVENKDDDGMDTQKVKVEIKVE